MPNQNIKIFHWNINGIRAILKKEIANTSFEQFIDNQHADIVSFNETKICSNSMCSVDILKSYPFQYHVHASKRGYSGVSVYSKIEPIKQIDNSIDEEGRIIALEYVKFIFIAVYVPNSGSKLARLDYRTMDWDVKFLKFCKQLEKRKPIIIAGDMNVAYMDIDIHNPEKHKHSAGFTDSERGNFGKLLRTCNLLDSWRLFHLDKIGYTYFDCRTKARERNGGWRIDYILVSSKLQKNIMRSNIISNIYGSDHIPITMIIKF